MKKDEYSFLELFGNIDDEYIVQALQPWKRQTRRYMVYHIGRKAVCLAFIVMLGLCLAFHDHVHAAVSRFTTMIAEILQSNDLEPYTDVINTTQEKDGISITLNEVILTNNSLLVSVNLDAETEYDGIGISVGESTSSKLPLCYCGPATTAGSGQIPFFWKQVFNPLWYWNWTRLPLPTGWPLQA